MNIRLSFPIAIIVFLAAFSENGYSLDTDEAFGYQFDEPKNYCRQSGGGITGFELYCLEGRIAVSFVESQVVDAPLAVLASLTEGGENSVSYLRSELTGKHAPIVLAEAGYSENFDPFKQPAYIAVFQFDDGHFAVVKGFRYKQEFNVKFKSIFRNLITTLEPF